MKKIALLLLFPILARCQNQTANTTWVNLSFTDTLCCSYTNYRWTQVSGPAPLTILQPDSSSTWVGPMLAGVYRFQVAITDSILDLFTASVQITMNPCWQPPRSVISMILTINGYPVPMPATSAIIKYSDGTTQQN